MTNIKIEQKYILKNMWKKWIFTQEQTCQKFLIKGSFFRAKKGFNYSVEIYVSREDNSDLENLGASRSYSTKFEIPVVTPKY